MSLILGCPWPNLYFGRLDARILQKTVLLPNVPFRPSFPNSRHLLSARPYHRASLRDHEGQEAQNLERPDAEPRERDRSRSNGRVFRASSASIRSSHHRVEREYQHANLIFGADLTWDAGYAIRQVHRRLHPYSAFS